jgi:hypothetical protein
MKYNGDPRVISSFLRLRLGRSGESEGPRARMEHVEVQRRKCWLKFLQESGFTLSRETETDDAQETGCLCVLCKEHCQFVCEDCGVLRSALYSMADMAHDLKTLLGKRLMKEDDLNEMLQVAYDENKRSKALLQEARDHLTSLLENSASVEAGYKEELKVAHDKLLAVVVPCLLRQRMAKTDTADLKEQNAKEQSDLMFKLKTAEVCIDTLRSENLNLQSSVVDLIESTKKLQADLAAQKLLTEVEFENNNKQMETINLARHKKANEMKKLIHTIQALNETVYIQETKINVAQELELTQTRKIASLERKNMASEDHAEHLLAKLRTITLANEANEQRTRFLQNTNEQTNIQLRQVQDTVELMQQEKEKMIENAQRQFGPVLAMTLFG